eukprot:1143427-Pelagomonas_calceolata.AAC.2
MEDKEGAPRNSIDRTYLRDCADVIAAPDAAYQLLALGHFKATKKSHCFGRLWLYCSPRLLLPQVLLIHSLYISALFEQGNFSQPSSGAGCFQQPPDPYQLFLFLLCGGGDMQLL